MADRVFETLARHLPQWWVIIVAAGLGVGFGATFGRDWRTGSVAEWVAGVGTISAVVAALWLAASDRRERMASAERAQAEQVAVWIDRTRHPTASGRPGVDVIVCVRNPSTSAIFNVVVWDLTERDEHGNWMCDPLDVDHTAFLPSVAPEHTEEVQMCLMMAVVEQPWLGVAFTDSGGRHWLRHESELDRLGRDPVDHFDMDLR